MDFDYDAYQAHLAAETKKVKCPKCDTVNAIAGGKKCKQCGHDLKDAIKAKFANMSAEFDPIEYQHALVLAKDSLAKASTPEPFSSSKTSNWVARAGGLPDYIQHIAHDLVEKRGKTESEAIQMAIGIVKNWARGGGKVDDNTRAAAQKAVAEWEALKAKSHAQSGAKKAA